MNKRTLQECFLAKTPDLFMNNSTTNEGEEDRGTHASR